MARPYTKYESDNLKSEFLKEYEKQLGVIIPACKGIGIHPDTFFNWKKKDADFAKKCHEVKEGVKDLVEHSLIRDAMDKGGVDRIFYMKTQVMLKG
jgi:hypothetical protein